MLSEEDGLLYQDFKKFRENTIQLLENMLELFKTWSWFLNIF